MFSTPHHSMFPIQLTIEIPMDILIPQGAMIPFFPGLDREVTFSEPPYFDDTREVVFVDK